MSKQAKNQNKGEVSLFINNNNNNNNNNKRDQRSKYKRFIQKEKGLKQIQTIA